LGKYKGQTIDGGISFVPLLCNFIMLAGWTIHLLKLLSAEGILNFVIVVLAAVDVAIIVNSILKDYKLTDTDSKAEVRFLQKRIEKLEKLLAENGIKEE
jgi:hypothetical protein